MQNLITFIQTIIKLDTHAIAKLEELVKTEQYSKGQHILEAGQFCNKLWFVNKGMVRKYHFHEGKELTCWMHTENDIFTSLSSYTNQTQSKEYIQACEPTEVFSITRKNSKKLSEISQFQYFSTIMMQQAFANIDIHTKEFSTRDAKGKYEYLRKIAPETIKRAKLSHIASILGITQETLSRIRRK